MNLYAYCLSDEITAGAIAGAIGIAGAPVRVIDFAGIRAVASDFEGASARVTRENIFSHEKVNRSVLAHTTPLPFRFGAVVAQAELEHYVQEHRARLLSQLASVRGAVEMSVKIIGGECGDKSEKANGPSDIYPESIKVIGPGAAFLRRKQQEMATKEAMKKEADEIALWLAERLGDVVRQSAIEVRSTEAILLDAAHLVGRDRIAQYRRLIADARLARTDLRFLTSGAWPPYSFCVID